MTHTPTQSMVVDPARAGQRLDAYLAERFPDHSRVQLRRLIQSEHVDVDGHHRKASFRLRGGETISIRFPASASAGPEPECIPLDVLWEDEHLVAINKPHGMVVHPSKGHWSGTLTAALAYHFRQLSRVGGPTRPGIVHRLDRDTSGVIVIAKTDQAHLGLASQFEERTVAKHYFALSRGSVDRDRDVIQQPIGSHPYHREKMAIRGQHPTSRDACTFYEVRERLDGFVCFRVAPTTGRTHQIRVHLAHIGCPVLCDPLYAGQRVLTYGELCRSDDRRILLDRLALHAERLEVTHPISRKRLEFNAPVPAALETTWQELRRVRPA